MIGALMAGALAGCGVLLWLSPGPQLGTPRGRRRSPRDPAAHRPAPGAVRDVLAGVPGAKSAVIPALPAAALVELTACQLETGLPLAEAVSVLADSCSGAAHPQLGRVAAALRLGLPWDAAWPPDGELSRDMRDFRDALEFTATTATASASVLRGQAELVRRAHYRRAERAAEALAVKLVLPLGLCFLPAFMCWGVVPVLMSLLPRVFGS